MKLVEISHRATRIVYWIDHYAGEIIFIVGTVLAPWLVGQHILKQFGGL